MTGSATQVKRMVASAGSTLADDGMLLPLIFGSAMFALVAMNGRGVVNALGWGVLIFMVGFMLQGIALGPGGGDA